MRQYETSEIEPREYHVYSDMLQQRLDLSTGKRALVIREYTSTGLRPISNETAEIFDEVFGIKGIQQRNTASHKLKDQFQLDVEIVLISEEELDRISSRVGGFWEEFDKQYDSPVMELSRVSFDEEMTHAHLYFGLKAHYHMGYGCHLILKNESSKWKIEHEFPAWKS